MEPTEDLSARVLLKHILGTEPPRTPITRSSTKVLSSGRITRSRKDAGAQTPQNILRRSLKNKMRESITRKSLPATTRRRTNTPAPASLFDEGDTPRHILKNILLTEPVKSPVVHDTAALEEPRLPSASSSITRKRPSTELSGLDLPDLTIGNAASTAKGLSRKRPRWSLNVTAFEKRLKDGEDGEVEHQESRVEQSSLSLSSSISLNLKTPFVDVHTEKRGLQRRVSNRRKITEEDFDAAVNNRQIGESSIMPVERGLSETAYTENFTLGLSKLSEPDITTDIVNCNTALYAQSGSTASNSFVVATQDKPTVMASQLQRQILEEEKSKVWKEKSVYGFPTEEVGVAEHEDQEWFLHLEKDDEATQPQKEDRESTTDEHTAAASESEEGVPDTHSSGSQDMSEEVEDMLKAQREESPQTEEEVVADSQIKGEDPVDSHTEEDSRGVGCQSEEDNAAVSQSDSEEEEAIPDSQAEENDAAKSLTGEHSTVDLQEVVETTSQPEKEGDVVESLSEKQQEEEDGEQWSEHLEHSLEHISRRAHCSEGTPIIASAGGELADATKTGWSEKSKAHSAVGLHSLEMRSQDNSQPQTELPDMAGSSTHGQRDASFTAPGSDIDEENVSKQEVMHDSKDNSHLSDASAAEADEQEEAWEDEEGEEVPCKTPAFVREKRNFFLTDPVPKTSLLKSFQVSGTSEVLPAAKPKQRRRTPAKKEPGLPKSYLMGVFKHFAKTMVSADVYPVLKETMNKFLDRLAEDLETYAHHAKRNTIEFEDAVLLLKRQGYVNDKVPVEALIEKYLRMDQRRLLIPIATSGNVVIPKKR